MVIKHADRGRWRAVLLVTLLTCCASAAAAQPTLSLGGSVFPAGPDFATDALGDPWDFSNILDLDPYPDNQPGWTTSAQARQQGRAVFLNNNGHFQATTDTTNLARVSLLFRGWTHVINIGRTGASNDMAVPTARYGKLAIKMRYTNPAPAAQGNQVIAAWYHRAMGEPDELSRAGLIQFGQPASGWGLYIVDLQTRQWIAPDGSQGTVGPLSSPFGGGTPAAWESSPLARGIEFRPQALGGYNVPVEVDWARLTTRDGVPGASTLTVSYGNCAGSYVLRVSDSEVASVPVARGSSSGSGSFTFNYGVLAPGAYTATLACANGTSSSQAFTINTPPLVTVIDPDVAGGADFATDVLGNPWDMADAADVPLIEGVSNPGFVNDAGLPALQATGTNTGDPRVTLLNGAGLINSGRYRRLTYTLTLDTPFGLSGGSGSLARVLWGSQLLADANSMTNTNDILVWPGRETYTVDLASLTTANAGIETDCGVCPTTPWASRAVRILRFDPHESALGVTFRLAQVKLAALDEVAQGQTFPVRYRFEDPDTGSTFSAQIYLDADRDPSSGLRLIGTMANVRPGLDQTFALTAPLDLPAPQEYFVYVRVTETRAGGISEARASYAGGPLLLLSASSQPSVTVSNPAPNSSQTLPLTISGCAYDAAASSGIGVDQVNGFAIAGAGVTGPQANTTQVLGFGAGFGTLAFPIACPSASGAFANAGFSFGGIDSLAAGSWTLRVMARSTLTGQFITRDVPFSVVAPAGVPQGFSASASGNTVTVSFSAPVGGPPVAGYLVEGATNPAFSPALFSVAVQNPGIYAGTLANGTYYLRIVSLASGGARIAATAGRTVIVGPPAPPAPGPPTLQLLAATNPVTLGWAPGNGGAPASYTIVAGSAPGASDLAVAPMGLATTITANAPVGTTVYVRVIASNAGGSATSNEVQFRVSAPQAPGAPSLAPASVSGNVVTLSWTPAASGGSPTGYTVLARLSNSGPIVASLPVAGTSVTVPASPGTYVVSVVGTNGAGAGPESNQITVTVR